MKLVEFSDPYNEAAAKAADDQEATFCLKLIKRKDGSWSRHVDGSWKSAELIGELMAVIHNLVTTASPLFQHDE